MDFDGVISDRRLQQLIDREDAGYREMELPDDEDEGDPMADRGITCRRCGKPKDADEMHRGRGMTVTNICKSCFGESVREGHAARRKTVPEKPQGGTVPRKTLRQAALCCPFCGNTLFNLKA